MDDRDLITIARSWPADPIDRTIIHDLADALEAHQYDGPERISINLLDHSGQEVTAND